MATRGPKLRSAENAPETLQGLIHRSDLTSPSKLQEVAQAEFDRLCEVLRQKGTIDRVDLAVVAECARIKALLDTAHGMVDMLFDPKILKVVGNLTTQRRGLLRELGLTLTPSRSVVRTNPVPAEEDPLAKLVKLSG